MAVGGEADWKVFFLFKLEMFVFVIYISIDGNGIYFGSFNAQFLFGHFSSSYLLFG